MKKALCLLGTLLALSPPAQANAMRCGNHLISTRDTAAIVLIHCGQPLLREIIYGKGIAPPPIGERWTYHMGKDQFTQMVTVINGRVVRIENGPRG